MVAWSKVAIAASVATVSIFLFVSSRIGKGVNVVWDLDDTLIKSVHVETLTDESKKNTIVKRNSYVCEHIDDDIMYFKTYIRPHTRFILALLKWCSVKQYVFTSATVGYMNNVCTFLDPKHNIFEPQRLSTSDFNKGVLSKNGKNIRLLFSEQKQDIDIMSCSMLIDDKIKYHKPQPRNGVLCNVFASAEQQELEKMSIFNDTELLRVAFIIFRCCFVRDVRSILVRHQPEEYRSFYDKDD